ncbi:hypothetical protein O3P69_011899 [Scylla paramamosain]|uniref:Uncharacterized protein n=1 Tax=Scylla paramamosain TaxID=85552 RepID=A0AAW0SA90_SCYPA
MLLEQRQRAETSPEQIVVPAPVDKSRPAPSGHPEHMPTWLQDIQPQPVPPPPQSPPLPAPAQPLPVLIHSPPQSVSFSEDVYPESDYNAMDAANEDKPADRVVSVIAVNLEVPQRGGEQCPSPATPRTELYDLEMEVRQVTSLAEQLAQLYQRLPSIGTTVQFT